MIQEPSFRLLVITGDHHLPDPAKPGERYNKEDLETHQAMADAFESMDDFSVTVWNDHSRILDGLRADPPDLVVNFCDTGYRNQVSQELAIPAYLDLLGIPCTGAPPAAMILCYDKQIVRLAAEAMDVAVPREVFLAAATDGALPGFYPALIKPNRADGSLGITKDAVIHDAPAARSYLAWLRKILPGADALYQDYLPGPEYGIGLIGNPETGLVALPPLEVDFSKLPPGFNPILSYESKSIPDSPYWTDISFKRADLPANVEARMIEDCKRLFKRFGLRDYARFDFRCAADGEPKLMEINPNPAWGNDGKLAFMSGFAGLSYADMLRLIVEAARARIAGNQAIPLHTPRSG